MRKRKTFKRSCCCCCCCCCCRSKKKPKYPQPLTSCEGSQCKEIRSMFASEGYDAATNIFYHYTQENVSFETAVSFCESLGSGFRLATLSELNQLSHRFIYFDENGVRQRCPTLVWSRDVAGNPVIVRLRPCSGENIEIITNFDLEKCMVQRICVSPATSG